MANYYSQPCPTCGRTLQVRVQYLGRDLQCQHCSGRFLAFDPEGDSLPASDSGLDLLARANELLEQSSAIQEWA